jgi:hypothetical protein
MSRIVRSAMLQMRVAPEIKFASEHPQSMGAPTFLTYSDPRSW